MKNNLYIVIPCYNEEEVIDETIKRLTTKYNNLIKLKKINKDSKIMLVNDGSKDNTWNCIKRLNKDNKYVVGINLSRNRGHQNALLAGLTKASEVADIVISMDADLQDDIEVIDNFIEEYNSGSDIVYGVRSSRKKDSFFKRNTALMFYKLMKLLGVDIVYNHADYRLMSKRALDALEEFEEVNLFLRGIVPLIGYKSDVVLYERNERFAGESKYPLKKMLSFAFEGITSFSVKPIKLILDIGIIMFTTSLLFLIYFIALWCLGKTVEGWATIVVSIWMLGGIQLLCLGVIGEYIGKIYIETKKRPKFIIDKFIKK